jgi:hypothetical protein
MDILDIYAVDENLTLLDVVESTEKVYDGRFSRTGMSDDGNCLSLFDGE